MSADVIIRKQKIKIRTADQHMALQLRKHLNDLLQYDLIVMMEKVFAQTALSDIYININRLNLDLGVVTVKDFEQHFVKLVEAKLVSELQTQVNENAKAIYTNSSNKNDFNADPSASVQYNSDKQQKLNALLYFLQKGTFPWWYKKELRQTPAELLGNLSDEETEKFLIEILSKVYSNEERKKIVERLFIHLPQKHHENIVYKLLALYNDAALAANIKTLFENKENLLELFAISVKEFYTQLFHFLLNRNNESEDNTVYNFILLLKEEQKTSIETLRERINTISNKNFPFADNLKQILASETSPAYSKKDLAAARKRPIAVDEEGIYIGNAGLVLLHPFLPAFFTEAGLLNSKNQFISTKAQQKGAVLLYYLQCGSGQYKEWEMVLNKIFCGIAADELLPEGILITEKEKDEGKILLQAVADFWEALKGASGEALQNTFILREGKITWKDEYWQIRVERTGVDILLEGLPWSFNTIKLPWLEHLIYVEW